MTKRNHTVTITRIIAMLFIILCHWYNDVPMLSQIFNVGVTVFFLISGYIYADRKIEGYAGWYKKRWLKLCIPTYILAVYEYLVTLIIDGRNDYAAFLCRLLNISGFKFIFRNFAIPEYSPWFITVIMLCYVQLILHKEYEKKHDDSYMRNPFYYMAVVLIQILLCLTLQIQIIYFVIFLIGYGLGKRKLVFNAKTYAVISAIMVLGMVARLSARSLLDGSLWYSEVIAPYSQIAFAVWILATIGFAEYLLGTKFERFAGSKYVLWLDGVSLYVYLVHGLPMVYVKQYADNVIGIIITVLLSLVIAWILKVASEWICKLIERKKNI